MNRSVVRMSVMVMALAGALPNHLGASGEGARTVDPLAKGKTLFIKYCAGCHGPQGQGDGYKLLGPDPANLTAPATKNKSERALLATIHEGKPNMPSWKGRLSERDIHNVLAYIRTLPQ